MDFTNKTTDELLERREAIIGAVELPDADLDALEEEARAIKEELETRKAKAKEDQDKRELINKDAVPTTLIEERKDTKTMENIEVRNSREYLEAYANYIKTGEDKECRALLTENVSGGVPVPEMVYGIVKTAWENNELMRLVRKTYVQGNLKVGFEISSTGAVMHTEGSGAIDEESLQLGIVTLVAKNAKKWLSVSDEILDLRGEAFLQYVYDELAYQIVHKVADELLEKIIACGTTSTATAVGVPAIKVTNIAQGTIVGALGQLSDEASNPVVVMNKQTYASFKEKQYAGNFATDIFEGLPVIFNNSLKPFATATTGETYAIVGDFGHGALANFPNGEELKFNFDDKTLATSDLVRIIGREYVAIEPVAPMSFVKLTK